MLAPNAVGFSSFDAGTADMQVLNDPESLATASSVDNTVSW